MTSIGNATPLICLVVLILALLVPPAAQQGGASPPINCPQNTVSVGVLIAACVAVLVGTLIFEGLAILCYRRYCKDREKPQKVAHRFMISPDQELVVKENLGYESDSDAQERSLREAKEKKRASIFNISETKDNMMYVPALYRNPITKDRDTGSAIMNGYHDYEPDYGMDTMFTYNAGWGSRVPNILSGKGNTNSLESLYTDADEYPILHTPHGVGPVNFASSKFRDGFGRKSIDIHEDDGDVTTYTYTTGFGGKVRREVATVTSETGDDIEIEGDRVTWRKCKLPDEVVLDMDEEEAKPETRIAIDDNFTIGKPTSTRRQEYTTAEVHSDSQGTSYDPSGNFILRATPSTSRSDSSDDDLYDYGDSIERQQQTLNMPKHSPGTIGHGTFRATVGGIPLDHGSSEEESPTELFNSRYRYSTGLNKAKLVAMRAAAAAHAREGILNEEDPPEDQGQDGMPPVMGYIKLVKPDDSSQDGSSEEQQYHVMPRRDSDSPNSVRLYPVNSRGKPISIQTQLPGGFSRDSYIRHRRETYIEVSDAGVQCEIIPRGGRPGQEKTSILRKERTSYDQEMNSVDDIPTIGVIRLMHPKSSKHVRIREDQTDYSTMTFSEEDLTSASLEDVSYRSTSRSNERMSPRPRRARSAPARSERAPMTEDDQRPFEEVPTIGVIRLVRPDSASDTSGVDSEVTSGEESVPGDRFHGPRNDKWTQHEVPIVRLAQQILQESVNERGSSQRSLHRLDQDMGDIPTIGVVRLVRPKSTTHDVRPMTSSRVDERFDESEETNRQTSSRVTPVSDMPTIGVIKLLQQESRREPTSRFPVSVVDRGTQPINTWAQLLREMHSMVESEILRKTSKKQHDQPTDETDALPRTISVIKLKREEVQAQPQAPYSLMDQSTQSSAEMRDEATMPTFGWSHLIHEVEDQIEERYKRMSAPAPKEEFQATKSVQKLGVIQLKTAPEKIIRDSFTQVSGPDTYEKSTGPAWSFKELVEEVEEEAVQKFKKTLKQLDRSAEPQDFHEPVRSVSVIKLKKEPGQEKLVRDSVTQISGPNTYEKSTGSTLTFAEIKEEIEEEAVREFKRTLSQLDRPAVVSQDGPQPVRSVSVIKLQKEPEAEKPTVTSRGVQPDLPWRELKEEIEDEAIEEYKKQMRRFQPKEAVQQVPETQAPTVSVIKLKGPKTKPAPEKWDNITQCDLIEPKPVMADQVTEPARPWSDVLHNVRRILENEYRRTITELETRLTSLPKDQPIVETVPTVAVFKLKGPDVHVQPEPEKTKMMDEKTQAAPRTSEQETAPERPWKNILTDVRKILENEYRRTIRELEDQLSGRDEPDSGKTMAYFKLSAPEVPKVQTVSMYTQIDAPQTGDQGTLPERPWGDLIQDVRSSVENEYRVTIRELESQLAERPKDVTKEPTRLGIFKLKGPKQQKVKKPVLHDTFTQPAKPWLTLMSEMEENVERRLSMKKIKPVAVEPEIVQQTQQVVEMTPQIKPTTADVMTQASQPATSSKASQSVSVQRSSMSTEANIQPNVTERSTSCDLLRPGISEQVQVKPMTAIKSTVTEVTKSSDFFQLFKPEFSMQETQASPSKTSTATMPRKSLLQEVGIQTRPSTEDLEVITDLVSTSDLSIQVEMQSTPEIPIITPTIMQPVHAPVTFKEPDVEKIDFAVQVVPEKTSRASATELRKYVDNFVQVASPKPTQEVFGAQVQPDVTDGHSSIVIEMKDVGTDNLQVHSTEKSTEISIVKELLDLAVQVKPEVKSRVAATDKKKYSDVSSQADDAPIEEMADTLDSSIQAVPNINVSFTSMDTPKSTDAFTQLKPLVIQQGDKSIQVNANMAEVGTETPVVSYVDNSSQMNISTLSQHVQARTLQADATTGKELLTNEISTQPDIATKQEVSVQVSMEIETEPAIIKAVVQSEQYSMPTLPTPAEVTDFAMQTMSQTAEFSNQYVPQTTDKYTEKKMDGHSFALQVSQNSTDSSTETMEVVQKTVPVQVRPRTVDKATEYSESKPDGIDIGIQYSIDSNEIGVSAEPQVIDDGTLMEIKLQLDVGTQADCEITVEPAIIQEVIKAPEESVALMNWDVETSDADTQTIQGETTQRGTSPDGIKTADAVVQHVQLRNIKDGSVQADPDVTTTGTLAFTVDHIVHATQVKPQTIDRGMTTVIRGSVERSNMANLLPKAYVKPPSKDVSVQMQPVSNLKTQSTLTDKTEMKSMPVQASPATSTHGQTSRPDVIEQWSMTDEAPEKEVIELIIPQIEKPVEAPIPILKAELLDKTTQVILPSTNDMFSSIEISQTQTATQYDHDNDEMSTQTDVEAEPELTSSSTQMDVHVVDTTAQTIPVKRETIGLSTDVTQFRASFTQYEPEQFKSSASNQTSVNTCSTGFSPEKIVLKSTGISPEKRDVTTSSTQYQKSVTEDSSMQTEEQEELEIIEEIVSLEKIETLESAPIFPEVELTNTDTQTEREVLPIMSDVGSQHEVGIKTSVVQTIQVKLESKAMSTTGPQLRESVVQYEPERFRTAVSSQTTVPTRTTGSSTEKASFKTTGVSPVKVDVKASSTQYQIAVLQDNSMQTEDQEEPISIEEFITVERAPVVEFMPEYPAVELADAETQAELVTTDRAILTDPETHKVMKSSDVQTAKLQLESKFTSTFGPQLKESVVQYEPERFRMAASSQTTVPTRTTGSSTEKASFKTTGVSPDKVNVKASSTQYQITITQDNSMQTEEKEEPIPLEEFVTFEQAPVVEFMPDFPTVELVDAETQAEPVTTDRAILTRPESREKTTSTFVKKYTQAYVQNVPRMTSVSQQMTMQRPQLVSQGTTMVKIQLSSIPTQAQPSTRAFGQMMEPMVNDHWSMTDEEPVEEMIASQVATVVESMPELPVETQDADVQVEPKTSNIAIETYPETAEQGSLVQPETREVPSQMSIHQATVSAQATVKHSTMSSQTDQEEKKRLKNSGVQTQQYLVTSSSYVPLKEKSYKSVEHMGDLVGIQPRGPIKTQHKNLQASVSTATMMSQSTGPEQTATGFQTEEMVEVTDMEVQTNPVTIIDFVPVLKDSTVQYEPMYFYSASTQAEIPTMHQHVSAVVQNRNQETTTHIIKVQPSSSQTEAHQGEDNSSQTDPMSEPEPLIAPMKIEPVLFAPPALLPETQVAESQTDNVVSTDQSTSIKLPKLLHTYAQVGPRMQDTNTMTPVKQYAPVAVQNEPEMLSQMMQTSPDVREGMTLTEKPDITDQASQHDTASMHISSQAAPESYDASTSFDLVVQELIEAGTQHIIELRNFETQTHTDKRDQASFVDIEMQESDCQTELTIEDLEEMLATLKQKLDEKPMVQEFIIPEQLNPVESPMSFPIDTEDSGIQTFLETVQRSTSPILLEVKHAITQYEAELKEFGVQVKPDVIDKEIETFIVKVHDAAIQYASLYGKDKPTQFSPDVNDAESLTDQKEYQHSYTNTKSISLSSKTMQANPQNMDKATTPTLQQYDKRATQTSAAETVTRWTQREILWADAPIQVRPVLDDATSQTDTIIKEDIEAILKPIEKKEVRLEMKSFKETNTVEIQTDPVIIKSARPDDDDESWLDSGIDTDVQTDPVVILSDLDSEIELMDEDSQTCPIDMIDADIQVETRKEVNDTTSQTSPQPQVDKTVQTMPKQISYASTVTTTPMVRPISSQTFPTKTATKGFQFEPVPYLTNEDIDTQTSGTLTKEQGTHALESQVETSTTQTDEMPVIEPEIIHVANLQPVEAQMTFSAPEAEVIDTGVQASTEVTDEDSQTTRVFTTDRPSSPGISYAVAESQTVSPAHRTKDTQYEPNAAQKKTQTEATVTVSMGTATYQVISQDVCLQTFLETKPEIVDRSMQHAAVVFTGYSQTEETQHQHEETQTDQVDEEIQFITPSPEFLEAFTQTTDKRSNAGAQTEGLHVVESGTNAPLTKKQVGVTQTLRTSTWSEGTVTEPLKSVSMAVQTDAIPVRVVDEHISPVHLQPVHAPLKLPEYKPELKDASIQADVKTNERSMQHESENTQFNIFSTRVVKGEVKPTVLSEFSMTPQKKHFISHLESSAYPKEETLTYKHFVHAHTQVKPEVDEVPVQVQPLQDDRSTATEEQIFTSTEVQTEFAEEPMKEVIRVSQVPLQQTPFLDLGPILMDSGVQVKPKTTDHGMSPIELERGPMLLDTAAQHEIYSENAFSQTFTYQQEKSTYTSIDVRQESSQATTEKKDSGVQAKTPKHFVHARTQVKPDVDDIPVQVQPIQDDQSTATEEIIFTSIEVQTEFAEEPMEEVIRISHVPEQQTPFLDLGPILIDTGTQVEPKTSDQGMSAVDPGPVLLDATAQHEIYLEHAVSQTFIDQQEKSTYTTVNVRQESSQATTEKRDAGVQAKTEREVSLMTSGIQTVVIHEEKPQMIDMAMQFRPLNTDQATLTSIVATTSSLSNTEPVNMRQAMVQVGIKPDTESRATLTTPKYVRNITTQAETKCYDACVQHDDLPDLADKGLQIKPVMVDDTSETVQSRHVDRPTQVDMDGMKPETTDVSIQHGEEKDMRDKISQVKPISTEAGVLTEVFTKDKGNQASFASEVDEIIRPDVTELQHAPVPFPEVMTTDKSIQHQPSVDIQTVQTSIDVSERASSPVGPDYSDVSSQTRTDASNIGLQTNFQETSTAEVQAVMSYFSEESYKMESVEEDLISAQVVTEEQHIAPLPTVQYQDAEMQYNPTTEDSTTETVSTGIDFANQSQPLTIEQGTTTDITKHSQAEVQVDIGNSSVITHETAVQHERMFKPVDVFTQAHPLTVEEGTSTMPLKKTEVSVQYIAPSDKRPSSPRIVTQTSDKGTLAQYVTSQSSTQTILFKSDVGIQSKPNTKSELTHAAIKPDSHDQSTATKPDVRAFETQTFFPKKSEGSQCDQTTLVHNTSQYERMFVEDNSVQVKPVIREQANSPIFKRKEVDNASSQTDTLPEDMDSSIEDLIRSAPHQPFKPQADSDFMHDYSDRLCEYLDRDEQMPVHVEHPIERIKELSQFVPCQENSSPIWDYAGDFSSRLYDTEMTESIDIIDRLFTSDQSTFELEEPIAKDETDQQLAAPKYYIESAVQTGPLRTKERSTSPLFPPTKEAQSQFDKDIGHTDTNVQASPITASESSYTAPVFSQDVSAQADFDIEEVPTSDAATQHYTLGQDISAQVEPLMTDAGMTCKVDSTPTSTQAKPETLEQGTSTLKQSTPTSDMQTQAKPDAVAKTTSPLAIRKNQMAVQTKVDQRHIPTQYDRVSSADAVVQMSPQSLEKGTSTKPENRDVSIYVIPTQRHESTQYEQSIKTMDFMVQYRAQHLDISTQSIEFKATCLDQASSPINMTPEKILQDISPITESPIQPVMVQQVSASPTRLQPFSRVDDTELRQEIRNEIRMEVIHEIREEIREEVREEVRKNQMAVQTKVDQHYIPTQYDRVSSADKVVQMSPQSLEKGTSTKPQNRDVSIHVIPTQRHETTQYEQSIKTMDFMVQYRAQHLDISTQSIDSKAACLDRASSPINMAPEKILQDTSPIAESPIKPVLVQQVSASPTRLQPFSPIDDTEVRQEIRNEIRMEVIREIQEEIREEVRQEIWEEVREELLHEVQHEVNSRVEMEVRDELRTELEITVREELREEFIEEYKEEILIEIKEELKVEFESRIRLEFEERTRDDLEFKIRREIEPRVRSDLEPIIRRELEQEYIKETIHEVRTEAPVMYQPSEYKAEPVKPLMLDRGTSPVMKNLHDAPTQVSTVTKDRSSQYDKPSKPVDGITQTKVYTVECGTTPDNVRTSDAPVQAQPSMTHRGTTPSEKPSRESGIQVVVQKMDKCDQYEAKPSQSDVSVQFSHDPQTVGFLCQVQPDTDEQGTSMEVTKIHQTYVQTENPLIRSENTQTVTDQMDATCQSEPVFHRDTTMQVKPVTFDKSTSTQPQETGDYSTQVELIEPYETTQKISVKQQDSSVQYERSMDVTDRRLQAKPVVREQANSPLSFLTFDIISPQRQDPVHAPFYTVQTRDAPNERAYITEIITGEKVPPAEHTLPMFTSPNTSAEPTSSKFSYSFNDRPGSTHQAKSPLEPLVARLDYVPMKSTDLDAIRPTVSRTSYRSSYESSYESSSRFTRDVLQSMPPRCGMILLQTTAAGTTYTSAFRTSTPTTRVSDPSTSLFSRTSILEQGKPVESTPPITSPILSDTESDSLPEMSELEKIRRDLRLSKVIVTDDQATLVGYFVNRDDEPQTPDLPNGSPFSPPEYAHQSSRFEYSSHSKFSHIPQSPHRGRQHFMNLEHTPTESIPNIIMDDEDFPTPTEEGDWFKRETSAYRLNVPYDKKGSPRPGARIVHSLSPSQSPSHTPGRMSPVFLSSEDGHPVELLPIPRGMVTRLSDLLSDGIPSDDESVLPMSRLSEMIEKHRELSQPPKWSPRSDLSTSTSQDPESEVDTTDSDTDTESFSAVMDFTDPFLHENPNFWRGGPTDFTTSSTNSDVSSDDDDVTVYGDCDVYSFDLPFFAPSKPSRSPQDASWMPGEPPRKRHSVIKIDRQRVREELSMSEVVLPDGPPRLTGYRINMDDGNWQRDRYSNRLSRSEPDLYRSTTSNATVTSPPSYSTAYPYTKLGSSRRHPAPEQLMVDAGSMPALSAEIRYAKLVKKQEISHTQQSKYSRLSHSDPDLASWQEELFDVGHF